MAHRGRLYPVHFRRDFNPNTSAKTPGAWPKGWRTTLHSGVAPPYIVDGHTFDLQEIAGPNVSTIAWLSPAVMLGLWLWQVRFHISFWQLPDTPTQPTWFLERDAIVVSSWRGIHSSRSNEISSHNQLAWEVLFTDFTTFPAGANFNFSNVNTIGYPP